jgi:hypothetical protein
LINHFKCSILFGSSCLPATQERVKEILNAENNAIEEKYLGLSTPEGRMSKSKFKTRKEMMPKKFMNWAERYISVGAKEVTIKSVVQVIPTYVNLHQPCMKS